MPLFSIFSSSVADPGAPGLEVFLLWEKMLYNHPHIREARTMGGGDVKEVSEGQVDNKHDSGRGKAKGWGRIGSRLLAIVSHSSPRPTQRKSSESLKQDEHQGQWGLCLCSPHETLERGQISGLPTSTPWV